MLGIPTIYDRVCQQALLNRLEPIFEPVFDDASFGYPPALEAAEIVGDKVARDIVEHWSERVGAIPKVR